MKLLIDVHGSTGFPQAKLAEAIGATFSATLFVGSAPTTGATNILTQYLEICLGLGISIDKKRVFCLDIMVMVTVMIIVTPMY